MKVIEDVMAIEWGGLAPKESPSETKWGQVRPGGQEGHGNSVRTTGCRTTGLAQGFGGIHVAIHPMKFIEDVIDELRCIAGPGCGCWKNSI